MGLNTADLNISRFPQGPERIVSECILSLAIQGSKYTVSSHCQRGLVTPELTDLRAERSIRAAEASLLL